MLVDYTEFLRSKMVIAKKTGISIAAEEISDVLKPHQRDAVMWAARQGDGAECRLFPRWRRISKSRGGKA